MPHLQFTTEDFKSPERLERLFRRLNQELDQPIQPPAIDIDALANSLAPLIRSRLQAPGITPLNLQSLLPAAGLGVVLEDTHANRLALYPASSTAVGTLFWETDRTVLYVVEELVGVRSWQYSAGDYTAAIASQPADLGASDAGFHFIASDTEQHYRWDGAAWVDEIQTAAALLRFAGVTASFPALKRSLAILQARLADDSAYTDLEVADEAYGAGWDGSLEVPTKNSIYDQLAGMVTQLAGLESAWTAWVPTYSSDIGDEAATFTATPTTLLARYKQVGKTVHMAVSFTGTLKAVTPGYIQISLPGGLSTFSGNVYGTAAVSNAGTYEPGWLNGSGAALLLFRTQFGAFGSGAAVEGYFSFTVEVA